MLNVFNHRTLFIYRSILLKHILLLIYMFRFESLFDYSWLQNTISHCIPCIYVEFSYQALKMGLKQCYCDGMILAKTNTLFYDALKQHRGVDCSILGVSFGNYYLLK